MMLLVYLVKAASKTKIAVRRLADIIYLLASSSPAVGPYRARHF